MLTNNLKKVLSTKKKINKVNTPFDEKRLDFINQLSEDIVSTKFSKNYPDLFNFCLWAKTSNLKKFDLKDKNTYSVGLVYHVCPSNVALTFAYSFVISFILGNDNIIKLPKKNFHQTDIFLKSFKKVLKKKRFKDFKSNYFVKYDHKTSDLTSFISKISDARIIWGGDQTVKDIQNISTKINTRDIYFSDKYSCSIINLDKFNKLNMAQFKLLINNFYRDSSFSNQMACTSPHLIIWYGKIKNKEKSKLFWEMLNIKYSKYQKIDMATKYVKFTNYCNDIIRVQKLKKIYLKEENISVYTLNKLDKETVNLRSGLGSFYEIYLRKLKILSNIVNSRFQTLSFFGFEKNTLSKILKKEDINGFSRLVPIGKSHEMTFNWDGYNLYSFLTNKREVIKE